MRVVDNNSPDDTPEVVARLARSCHPRALRPGARAGSQLRDVTMASGLRSRPTSRFVDDDILVSDGWLRALSRPSNATTPTPWVAHPPRPLDAPAELDPTRQRHDGLSRLPGFRRRTVPDGWPDALPLRRQHGIQPSGGGAYRLFRPRARPQGRPQALRAVQGRGDRLLPSAGGRRRRLHRYEPRRHCLSPGHAVPDPEALLPHHPLQCRVPARAARRREFPASGAGRAGFYYPQLVRGVVYLGQALSHGPTTRSANR